VKRIGSILFLAILVASMLGPYGYFMVRLRQIRQEMRAALRTQPDDKLEVLQLSQSEYQMARVDEHEIKVHDRMYDIARVEQKGEMVMIYCLHDQDEDSLLSLLDSILKNAGKDKRSVPPSSWSVVAFQLPETVALDCILPADRSVTTAYQFMASEPSLTIFSPPPRRS
jgi:hypothetical protein